jgi:hypothetical protein
MDDQPFLLGEPGDLLHGLLRGLLVWRAAPVKRGDRVLVLAANAQALVVGREHACGEGANARRPRSELGVDLRGRRTRAQQLAAVVADVGQRADRDDLASDRCAASADAGDDGVALGDLDQQRARGLGHMSVGGVAHDRRERAVDVEQDRPMIRVGADRLERLHERRGGGHDV